MRYAIPRRLLRSVVTPATLLLAAASPAQGQTALDMVLGIRDLPPMPVATPDLAYSGVPAVRPDVALAPRSTGLSGAVRIRTALPGSTIEVPLAWTARPQLARWRWLPTLGTPGLPLEGPLEGDRIPAPQIPGSYVLEIAWENESRILDDITLLVQVPLERRANGRIDNYYIGRFPNEGEPRRDRYRAPVGLIRVTPENQRLQLSPRFTLRDFLTHDQQDVWPKYVLVDPLIIDKLELVMRDLAEYGIPADHMVVMSGFRTPQYNARGLDDGRASLSRHQYGDAADVWIDNDGDWYMDDLNRDGRRDLADARIMLAAVERVEAAYPQLIGGAGVYPDNGAHGPFIHIDVRGRPARW